MILLQEVGKALLEVIKWITIIGTSILAPSIGIWAIFKLVKYLIKKLTN